MEINAGLSHTFDEKWGFWNHPVFPPAVLLTAALAVLAILILNIIKKYRQQAKAGDVTFRLLTGFKNALLPIILGGAVIVLLLAVINGFSPENGNSAILLKTEALRVPDTGGAVNTRFSEGQPVKLRTSPGEWYFVESADGRQGWVPAEAVIPY